MVAYFEALFRLEEECEHHGAPPELRAPSGLYQLWQL